MSIYEAYKGKKVDVNYETGHHFIIEYLRKASCNGRFCQRQPGVPSVEEKTYVNYEISDSTYMINWIEESGLVVSQIADFPHGKVWSFMTWPDEKERGHRAHLLHK